VCVGEWAEREVVVMAGGALCTTGHQMLKCPHPATLTLSCTVSPCYAALLQYCMALPPATVHCIRGTRNLRCI
jgi:hypothetical protein